jgi:hypothetical protein
VVLGRKTVPLAGEMVLQGGVSKPVAGVSKFIAASNGQTLVGLPAPAGRNTTILEGITTDIATAAAVVANP